MINRDFVEIKYACRKPQLTTVDAMLRIILLFVLCEVFGEDFGYPELSGQRLDSSKNEVGNR